MILSLQPQRYMWPHVFYHAKRTWLILKLVAAILYDYFVRLTATLTPQFELMDQRFVRQVFWETLFTLFGPIGLLLIYS